MRPNVVLIVLDTARADAFEPYGAPPGSSPAFADLARRGAAADAMYAAAPWTLPSHTSLFSGLLPRAAGATPGKEVPGPAGFGPTLRALRDRLLPEVLRRAGYATGAVSGNVWISEPAGFDTGFERFVSVAAGRRNSMARKTVRGHAAWLLEGLRAEVDDGAAAAERVFRGWLADTDRPFFWFVNLNECHSPYLPPKPYNDLGPLDRLRATEEARRHLVMSSIWKACAGGFDVPDGAIERMKHLYAGAVRQVDDWLARLLTSLDEAAVLDDTLVVVTSDHGENFGEGGLMGHACSLDSRLIRVPFAAAGPGAFAPSGPTSLAAVPRLIADAIGLAEHPWRNGLPAGDAIVSQFDSPFNLDDAMIRKAAEVWEMGEEGAARITASLTCATDGRYKVVLREGQEEVYDLEADPLELNPIGSSEASLNGAVASLRQVLADPVTRAEAPPLDGHGEGEVDDIPEAERRELEERMRALGYM